jgi:hypothetical protein
MVSYRDSCTFFFILLRAVTAIASQAGVDLITLVTLNCQAREVYTSSFASFSELSDSFCMFPLLASRNF